MSVLVMRSMLQKDRTLAPTRRMDTDKRTISQEDLQAEWIDIQAAQQDPAHFRPLYQRYYEPIFRFIFRRTADEALSADICSQVFLKAMQRIGGYRYQGVPFSAWLFRIASNEVAQHFRQTNKKRVVSVETERLPEMIDTDDTDDFPALQNALVQALDQLKDSDLQLIEMRFFEHRPFKEIAEILEISESNAKVRTYRILERIKKKMTTK